jgi:hypothetical protein
MIPTAFFEIEKIKIVLEKFEDEIVIVNLENGYYYSLSGIGSDILGMIGKRYSVNAIRDAWSTMFPDYREEVEVSLNEFLLELENEGIIIPSSAGKDENSQSLNSRAKLESIPAQSIFSKPILNRYTDMREILLLDPIHEVDANTGWPQKKPAVSDDTASKSALS